MRKFKLKAKNAIVGYAMLVAVFYGCDHPERMAWNWNDNPKSICDTTLPKGIIIRTNWTGGDLIVTIKSNGKTTKWVKDENLKREYLVNDTIKHCH